MNLLRTRWRDRNPGASSWSIALFAFGTLLCSIVFTLLFRYRKFGLRHVPSTGPLLVIANHQSHLDPVAVGIAVIPRQMNYLARASLFFPGFGTLIRLFNAVPLKQDAPDTAAIRAALEQLGMGRAIVVFPEGSRTPDGRLHQFRRGTWLLLSRAKCDILPVAVEGAYDAFPRRARFPRLFGSRIAVNIGPVISGPELLAMGDEAGLRSLERTIEALRVDLAQRLRRDGAAITSLPAPDRPTPVD